MFLSFRIDSAEFFANTGNLLIQTRNNSQARYLLSSWEQGLNLFQDSHQGWVFLNQGPNILFWGAPCSSAVQLALDSFLATVPLNIQASVAPYKWRQLGMLRLLRISSEARDLIQDSPLLLWLLADRVNEADLTLDHAHSLIMKRRDQILEYVLGDASKSLVRFLNKLRPLNYDHQEIRLVYQVIRSKEALVALRHCHEISLDLLSVVMEQPECAHLPLVRSLLEQPGQSAFLLRSIRILLNGCLKVAREHNIPDIWTSLSRCGSLAELERLNHELHNRYNQRYVQQKTLMQEEEAAQAALHDRIATAIRAQEVELARSKDSTFEKQPSFPPPPFPGNDFIKPVTSPEALRYEGSKNVMHNCVKDREYVKKVVQGESYIYRVYKPQRCTLEIERTTSGAWRINQLKLRKNESPRPETKKLVQEWLNNENLKIG